MNSNNGSSPRRVIGGGLSGLAAAINFAKNDEKVEVHEAREDIGMQFHPNYQVLLKESPSTPASESDAKSYLNRWGLNPEFQYKDAKKFLCCTQKRDFTISLKEPLPLILRGGENSLERGLSKQAEDLGVDFHFKSRPKARPGDIMSAGSYRTDMAADGAGRDEYLARNTASPTEGSISITMWIIFGRQVVFGEHTITVFQITGFL